MSPGAAAAGPSLRLLPARLDAWLFRASVSRPMVTSFGRLDARSALILRLQDEDGQCGWGEAYCNFPPRAGEHRLNLIEHVIAPMLLSRPFDSPEALFDASTRTTRVLGLQTGEEGPLAQCVAALDIAAWDLAARRAGRPLAALLAAAPATRLNAYCTGIAPVDGTASIERALAAGHRRFKLKLGFGREVDLRHTAEATACAGRGNVALDPNQAWDLATARAMARELAAFDPLWLEEPIGADAPLADWCTLARDGLMPLATGENLLRAAQFEALLQSGSVAYLQPDPIKWGGISGIARLAPALQCAQVSLCPHYIGTALGWMATLHLAAAFGDARSMLEVDEGENPLRDCLGRGSPALRDGQYALPSLPGLGVEPDLEAAAPFLLDHRNWHATRATRH